ncbi:MAG: ABC transporter ATP-binding protein [Candidatus Atribacteria bacterium]|nr:ABC transporter ATP-binding protein [Candidatus Atribacteria bacterium]
MPVIKLNNISKYVCKNINLEIFNKEFLVLLGPNGAGKSTLLNVIAGLIDYKGSVFFENKCIDKLPVSKRKIGYLFQDLYLFPHLNIFYNIAFSLKIERKKPNEIKYRVEELLQMLRIENLTYRYPKELSGGEKQRVAIARALYSQPKILLLDEPLSAIDPTFRNAIMKNLKEIHRRYDLTTIHVTHNFREASYLADKIAIIMHGRIEQVGSPDEVLNQPQNIDVAKFLGFKNIFPTTLIGENTQNTYFSVDPNNILVLKNETIICDYIFEGYLDECMGITDHFKLFVNVGENQFFIKILKREYENCVVNLNENIKIGFNVKDVIYI